jgi:hypothetical protein
MLSNGKIFPESETVPSNFVKKFAVPVIWKKPLMALLESVGGEGGGERKGELNSIQDSINR